MELFMEVYLHLGNILLRLADDLRSLSDEQLYKLHGSPVLEPVRRLDGEPLPPGVPSHVVQPIWLGKPSEKFQLSEARVLLADFGEAFCPAREVNGESRAPLAIRPPEARFDTGRPLSFPSDIWMLACTIWAILGQRSLFDGLLATPDDMTREHVDALGMLPPVWWSKWDARRQWFTDAGGPTIERLVQSLEDRFEHSVQRARRNEGMPVIDPEEKDAIFAMLRSMLLFRPEARHTASQVLKSEWMEKWALPAYKKI
ncbi:MAG: hypothetical protein M1817_006439 [Caeruleum heppii]|nr:MAG: hypothetical protein M1817_006439 [Caeruleum heppii]